MRWLIAAIAFLAPVLIAVQVAAGGAGDLPSAAIGSDGIADLRSWFEANQEIIEHYAPKAGDPERTSMPHVALDRFDRSGCDHGGHPWFTLGNAPPGVECGVLRREAGQKVAPAGHASGLLLLRLRGDWLYWEWRRPDQAPQRKRSGS